MRRLGTDLDYRSTLHTDDTLLAVLELFLRRELDVARDEVAILQETSTEYGQALASSLGGPSYRLIPFDARARRASTVPVHALGPAPLRMCAMTLCRRP